MSCVVVAASFFHLDSGEKTGDKPWSMARAVGTQHKEGSGDTRGLLCHSFGGHPARVTPDPSGSYLMAPQQHAGKERATFVPIRQIAKTICTPTKEFTEKWTQLRKTK